MAASQTVGYGVLYYAFSVLLTPIATELGATEAAVTGALTVSIVVAAAVAIPVGRWLDHHGGRGLMTGGAVLGVLAAIAWSRVTTLGQLYAVFVLIGLAGAACLYEAAFPVVIAARAPHERTRALLSVTVVAGLASTIFFPLTGALLARLGWRGTVVTLAVVFAVVAVPLHAALVPGRRGGDGDRTGHDRTVTAPPASATIRAALADPGFRRVAGAFVGHVAANASVGVLLVSYLRQAGHPPTVAATLAGLLGLLSVTGRVVTTGFAARYEMARVTAVIFVVQAVGVALLTQVGRSLVGAALCVVAFGLGFGVGSIARPAIVAQRYGTDRYATIMAVISTPTTLARAAAPVAAASVPATVYLSAAGALCLAAACALWTVRAVPEP